VTGGTCAEVDLRQGLNGGDAVPGGRRTFSRVYETLSRIPRGPSRFRAEMPSIRARDGCQGVFRPDSGSPPVTK
jgi:hypothetical protein